MTDDLHGYFAAMYGRDEDPYGLRTRWYEERKRQVLLAALPQQRYHHAYEPGCGAAELTVRLAERCDALLASDFDPGACEVAHRRTAHLSHVRIETHQLPSQWPQTARFDLVVLSEIGYFLSRDALSQVAIRARDSLTDGGTLVSCNWKPDFDLRQLSTDAVHALLHETLQMTSLVRHDEADFTLQVWSRDGRSVAQREGWA
ncbi:SAM-dependent methyltransferase [Variovorax dokdonensis]|uniref:SAM-dependent methyltransferase n=1 Tax=Variovorax dokdonensis TaxID=344883 RepID=A0ABT7NGV6_9BURK|nr:SAM-dependent methyltransferase [Variovorax dokdonensis]MDM0047163.1 SAM-dependent methyltransferase [Variovorax dokdonensis]